MSKRTELLNIIKEQDTISRFQAFSSLESKMNKLTQKEFTSYINQFFNPLKACALKKSVRKLLIAKKCKNIIGIDISNEFLNTARIRAQFIQNNKNIEFRCTKIEKAGFKNGEFDKIVSICVLEHIPNYIEVLEESYRILKSDGQIILSVDSLEHISQKN